MDVKFRRLLQQVRIQLEASAGPLHNYNSTDAGVSKLQQTGQEYYTELVSLRRFLSELINGQDTLLTGTSPVLRRCLWKIPALCQGPSTILDPKYLKQQCLDFQDVCGFTGGDIYTKDIWESQQLHDWARAERSLLLIQGCYQSSRRLERFSAELWDFLVGKQPTVAILQSPASLEFFNGFDERELLRQIALQALQKASVDHPVYFLADILHLFLEASTFEDWFVILEKVFQMFSGLILIASVSALGERAESTMAWPSHFATIMERLQNKSSTCLKVLLITTHPFWTLSDTPSLFLVDPAPETNSYCGMDPIGESPEHDLPLNCPVYNRSDPEAVHISKLAQAEIMRGQPEEDTGMHETQKASNRPEVEIAILCALPLEADAIETIFNKKWSGGYRRSGGDTNTYSLGVIDRHGVVLVHMPGMGTCYAATVAAYCKATFPKITLALVVGICGGVPFSPDRTELLLGDVAISEGLVRYDFGRQYPDGFVRKNSVSESARKLPAEILGYLAKLKGHNARKILRERTATHLITLRQEREVVYPGLEKDILFESTYSHKHHAPSPCNICDGSCDKSTGMTCEQARSSSCKELKCDIRRAVTRQRQNQSHHSLDNQREFYPAVHFGKFGSGDKVMKSGEDRDRIARDEDIIAFEMEGAGVWDILPCVIIKGICDYSDSHKDKRWQEYAAVTAAACTKAFLEGWRE